MSVAYRAHLANGATTLCRCFRLTRKDGTVLGFTDHDEAVTFDSLTYRADSALSASDAAASLGLAPDEMEASGALAADAITEADLLAGLYDGATVEVYDVNWRDTSVRGLLARFTVGQVERGPLAFTAELRSMTAALDRKQGRLHTTLCDVRNLGDARCALALSSWQATATVASASGATLTVTGLDALASGHFDRGTVLWLTGANAGAAVDLRLHRAAGSAVTLALWRLPPRAIAAGDTLRVTAGCDRTASMCRDRFGNLVNFRGFPHMPGESFVTEYGKTGDPDQTGGSRFA